MSVLESGHLTYSKRMQPNYRNSAPLESVIKQTEVYNVETLFEN